MKKVNLAAKAANDAKFAIEFPELAKLGITKEEHDAFLGLVNGMNVRKSLRSKDFMTGTVVQKSKDGVYIAHGTKHDAFCPIEEGGDLQVGETATFWVLNPGEYEKAAIVSRQKYLGWERLAELKDSKEVVSARVFFVAKEKRSQIISGLRVCFESGVLKGLRGFLPYRETADRGNIESLLNTTLDVIVTKVDPHSGIFGDLVVSNRQVEFERTRALIAPLESGTLVEGTVKKILNLKEGEKGVLVELCPGVTGMLYTRDIATMPGQTLNDQFKIGSTRVFEIKRTDLETGKVWLATRRVDRMEFEKQLAKDQVYTGKVVRSFDYGMFVQIGCELNGLVHVSELSKFDGDVKIGDMVSVKVRQVDEKRERIGLQLLGFAK